MIKLQEKETPQATFDFVVSKLREQGKPSATFLGGVFGQISCNYGDPGGCRCAVGHLMGDAPDPGAGTLRGHVNYMRIELPRNMRLLERLQAAHDDAASAARTETGIDAALWRKDCARRMVTVAGLESLSPATATAWLESLQ